MSKFYELIEKKIGIQVVDPSVSVKDLKKKGVSAHASKKWDDEIEVNLKDKDKVREWMLSSGWDKSDIEDLYPELLEATEDDSITMTLTEVTAIGKFKDVVKNIKKTYKGTFGQIKEVSKLKTTEPIEVMGTDTEEWDGYPATKKIERASREKRHLLPAGPIVAIKNHDRHEGKAHYLFYSGITGMWYGSKRFDKNKDVWDKYFSKGAVVAHK
jgi:hypothetical protein